MEYIIVVLVIVVGIMVAVLLSRLLRLEMYLRGKLEPAIRAYDDDYDEGDLSSEELKNDENKRFKILFVEQDQFMQDLYASECKKFGVQYMGFADANGDLIQKVINVNPDLISLSVIFAGRDGFEAIKMLKADERTKNIPVIFLTNFGQKEDIQRGLSLGAVDYLIVAQHTPSEVLKLYLKYLKTGKPQEI